MPATSKAQRRFMAMCEHNPKHAQGECPDMSKEEMHKYASTKESGLPERKKKKSKRKRNHAEDMAERYR